ncbi:hypothetical protein KSF78_0007106 [Schistosoma japonicum]|nr:hypothetical protein KSF78_0007106 [Schistosoma japonicum]
MLAIILLYTLYFIGNIQYIEGDGVKNIVEANQKLPKVQNGTVCNGTDKCLLRKPNQTNSNHVIVHYVTNVTKPTIVHNGSNSHLPKTTQHTTVTVTTTANQKLPKVQNGTVCNGTDKCLLRKPNQTNSNHVIVHYVTNVTKPTIVHNGSNSHLPKTTQHTTVTVTTTANQKLPKVQNGTVCNGTDKCLLRKPNQTNSNHVIVHYVTNVTKPTIVHNGSIEIRKPKDVQQLGEKKTIMQKINDGFFYLFSEQEFHPLHDKSYLFNIWYLFKHSFFNLKNMKNLIFGS